MKRIKGFSKLVFLSIFIIAIVIIFAFSGCWINVPLKIVSRAASEAIADNSAESIETVQSGDSINDETTETFGQESTPETSAQDTEDTTAFEETASESTEKTAEDQVAYSNDFTLYDLDKNLVSMHDYAGKIVVLNFWATWCPPCIAEIPDFVAAWDTYKSKNIQFFGISDDDVNAIADFVKENKVNYPTLLDGSSDRIMQSWGIDAIPHTFILNGSGEIIFDQLGMMSGDQLINAIEDALNKQ